METELRRKCQQKPNLNRNKHYEKCDEQDISCSRQELSRGKVTPSDIENLWPLKANPAVCIWFQKHYPINSGKLPDNSQRRWFVFGFIVAIILFTSALLALFYTGKVKRGKGRRSRSFYGRFKALLRRTRLLRQRRKSSKLKRSTTKIPMEDQAPSGNEQQTSATLTNVTSRPLTTNGCSSPSRGSTSSIQEQEHKGKCKEGVKVQVTKREPPLTETDDTQVEPRKCEKTQSMSWQVMKE